VASSQTDTLIGGGVALATIGGVLMGLGVSENSSSGHLIWANPWFATGCVLLVCGIGLVLWMLTPVVLAAQRRRKRLPTVRETVKQGIPHRPGLGRGLGALIPDTPVAEPEPATPNPLRLKLVDETWRLVYNAVWVMGIEICITSRTDKPIILTQYYLQPHPGVGPRPPLADKVWTSVNALLRELKAEHASAIFDNEITVPPLGSVTRWIIHTAYIPAQGGRPRCTFGVKDTLDNLYKFDIAARAANTYHIQS
jgi:hypothetical protein